MDTRVVNVAMVLMILCTLNTQVNSQVNTMKIGDACQFGEATGDACDDIVGTTCQGGTCRCLSPYYGDDGGTICTKKPIGSTCITLDDGPECSKIDNAACSTDMYVCECKVGYFGAFGTTTCTPVSVGDSCSLSVVTQMTCRAVPGGHCVDGKCSCGAGSYAVDITPYVCTAVRIGEGCAQSGLEVYCLKIPNAECPGDTKECQCKNGFDGVVGSTLCTPEPQEATVRCTKRDNEMTMEIRVIKDSNHQQIVTAKGAGELTTSDCKTSTVSTNKEFLELTITVNIGTREQTDPVKETSDCFVKSDGVVATKVNVLVVGQTDAEYVKGTDKFYKVVCDSDTANGEVVVLEDVGITSAIDPTEKTSEVDGVKLELVKADDSALTLPVSLTEEVKLKVTLTRQALVTAPLGLFLKNLKVSDKAEEPDNTLEMLNEHGCVQEIAAFKPESTFAPVDGNLVAASATKFEALTGKFSLALFTGMEELTIFFSVEYEASCFVNTEDKCFNLEQYCTDNTQEVGRRRRSATEVKNGTATLGVSVYLGGPRAANQDGVGGDSHTQDECQTSQYFWIVSVVLGCLALTALLFAFFLFRRLRREQRRSDKLDEKFGVRNPAF